MAKCENFVALDSRHNNIIGKPLWVGFFVTEKKKINFSFGLQGFFWLIFSFCAKNFWEAWEIFLKLLSDYFWTHLRVYKEWGRKLHTLGTRVSRGCESWYILLPWWASSPRRWEWPSPGGRRPARPPAWRGCGRWPAPAQPPGAPSPQGAHPPAQQKRSTPHQGGSDPDRIWIQ